jgi:hypothetical protein
MAEFFTNYPQAQKPMSLGEMLNMAGGVQQYQQAQQMNPLALQKAKMEVEQAQQLNPLAVQKAQEEVSQAKIGTQEKQYGFNDKQAKGVFSAIGGIMQDKRLQGGKEDVLAALLEAKQRASITGASPVILEGVFAPLMSQALDKPEMVKNSIGSIIREGMSSESKQALQTPSLTTNAAGQLVAANPVNNTINVLGENNAPAAPAAPAGFNPQSMTKPQGAPMSANPSRAQTGLLERATETAASDWANTVADANTAQGRIAIFQNIKSLTPDAFTGVGGERKKFLSGLAQSVGIPLNELETSTTDELTKNAKLLALAGGNTDAARGIAEMATPNAKMTKEAIQRVANQLIGVEKLKQSKADFLAPYLTNPAQYQQKLNEFQKFSDFRLFQEMSPSEVATLKASMSPEARKEMGDKIQEARRLGIIK